MKDLKIPCLIQGGDSLISSYDPAEELVDLWVSVDGIESIPIVISQGGAMLLIEWLKAAYGLD